MLHRLTNFRRRRIQLGARRTDKVSRRECQAETVIRETRKDMQMRMEDFLAGRLTIGQKQVHPLARKTALAQCRCRPHSHGKYFRRQCIVQVSQQRQMTLRNDEHVTWIDRLDVHNGQNIVCFMDEAHG